LELIVRAALLIAVVLAVLLGALPAAAHAARGGCVAGHSAPSCSVWTGKVTFVGDGDTIDVDVFGDGTPRSRRVRITGIQAMEQSVYSAGARQGDCHAVEATQRLERLIGKGRRIVRLAAEDPESMSRNRLLRTVAVKVRGRWVDAATTMLGEGLALWWPSWAESAGNRSYSVHAQAAIAAQRGLFDPDACGIGPSAASPLKLWVNWDADGNDTANTAGEWVKVRNLDPVHTVGLGGWYLRDSGLRRFTFPAHASIPPGGTVTVNVGRVGESATVFSWGRRDPVFENASHDEDAMGDGAYLFDPLGNVRGSMLYPCAEACSDPLEGAVGVEADPRGRREFVAVRNLSAGPIELDGYVLKSAPQSYHFGPGSVIGAGEAMRIQVTGQTEDDSRLLRSWGFAKPILRDAGDVVRLATYTDITLACTAWGDKSC
jgi:endonuclease YncB( thermonuclease family)